MDYGFAPHKNSSRSAEEIANDGFFPALTLTEFADLYGIPADLQDSTVTHFLMQAMSRTNIALANYKAEKIAEGITNAVNASETLGGISTAVTHYKAAAYAAAKADLLREHTSIDRKADAENAATNDKTMIDHYEALASRALANLIGQQSIGVHLI